MVCVLRVVREGCDLVMTDSSTYLEVALNLDLVHFEIPIPDLTGQARIVI